MVVGRARAVGLWVIGGATNGAVELNDSATTGGTSIIKIDVPGITVSGTTFAGFISFQGVADNSGLQFQNGIAASLSVATACTVLYSLG